MWESLRKERDFYINNYMKTENEKKLIGTDIKTLEGLHDEFTTKISDLKNKYEGLCKSKSLMDLETNKLVREMDNNKLDMEKYQKEMDLLDEKIKETEGSDFKIKMPLAPIKQTDKTPWPKDVRNNIFLLQSYSPMNSAPAIVKPLKAHDKPIGCMAVHIKKHVIATGSDDCSFKLFNMQTNEEMASAVAHSVNNQ
jgi:WD40 repeat protein